VVLTFYKPGDLVWVSPARSGIEDQPATVIATYLNFVTVRAAGGRVLVMNRSRVKRREDGECN
jgi:hypothetical protein